MTGAAGSRICSKQRRLSPQPLHTGAARVKSIVSQLAIHMLLQMVPSLFFSLAADMIHGALCLDLGSLSYFLLPTVQKHFSKIPLRQQHWSAYMKGKKKSLVGQNWIFSLAFSKKTQGVLFNQKNHNSGLSGHLK